MANKKYSWKNVRQASSFSLPQNEHFGRVVMIAVVLALVVHAVMFIGLKRMHVVLPSLAGVLDVQTEPVVVREVEFRESLPETQQEELAEPPQVAGELLDEIEILEEIPEDVEIDMSPDVVNPEFDIAMEEPAMKGDEFSDALEPIDSPNFADDLPELGHSEDFFQEAAAGQVVIDPGEQKVNEFDSDKFNEELERKGAGGLADEGALDSFTPLSAMTRMSGNALQNSKGMIGSDLLFEFNQALLRESARNSLLKVALLIDKNPGLNCWIEGHTDTIGGDLPNGELSMQRALAVKTWLVESMRIDPARLIVVGYGKRQPIVAEGDQDQQAINRRVVIKMRKGEPTEVGGLFLESGYQPETKQDVAPAEETPSEVVVDEPPAPSEAAVVVEEEPAEGTEANPILIKPSGPPNIPVAEPVIDDQQPARAVIEPEESRRAILVEPGRAVPVE